MNKIEFVYLDGTKEEFECAAAPEVEIPFFIKVELPDGRTVRRCLPALRGWTFTPGKLAIARSLENRGIQ